MTTSDADQMNEGVVSETYFSPLCPGGSMMFLSDTSTSGEDTRRERSKTAPCCSARNGQARNASEQSPPPAQAQKPPPPSRHTYPALIPSDSVSPSLPVLLESTEPVPFTDSPRSMAPCELQDSDADPEEIGGRNGVQPRCRLYILPNRHLSATWSGDGELRPNAMPTISSVGSLPIDGEDVPRSEGRAEWHWGHHGPFSEAPPAGGASSRSGDVSRRTC